MSLLWPDTVHVGLFPGASWLKTKRTKGIQPFSDAQAHDPGALLGDLETALDALTEKLCKGSNIVVTVSDSIAAVTTMPWQSALSRTDELKNYARICFEKLGMEIDDGWTMHAEFRDYGAMGLAYALPNAWLVELIEMLKARDLKLQNVLPASARIYS